MPDLKLIPVRDLEEGDLCDLEGDPYCQDCLFAKFEYATVVEVIHEDPTCTAVGFDGYDVVGFPPDHLLPVLRGV